MAVDTFINVVPSSYINRYWSSAWSPCEECSIEEHCDSSYHRFQSIKEDFNGFNSIDVDLDDCYWSCEHKEYFFSPKTDYPIERLASGSPSWADIVEFDFSILPPPKSDLLSKYEKEMDDHLQEMNLINSDKDYSKSKKIEAFVECKSDLQRGLKKKNKKVMEPCKYMLMLSVNPKALTYSYVDKFGHSNIHRHCSCWGWEYTDPKTGIHHSPRICERLHPGEEGWNDDWIKKAKFPSSR